MTILGHNVVSSVTYPHAERKVLGLMCMSKKAPIITEVAVDPRDEERRHHVSRVLREIMSGAGAITGFMAATELVDPDKYLGVADFVAVTPHGEEIAFAVKSAAAAVQHRSMFSTTPVVIVNLELTANALDASIIDQLHELLYHGKAA